MPTIGADDPDLYDDVMGRINAQQAPPSARAAVLYLTFAALKWVCSVVFAVLLLGVAARLLWLVLLKGWHLG